MASANALAMNKSMRLALKKRGYGPVVLNATLVRIVNQGFQQRSGAYLLRACAAYAGIESRVQFPDLTGYECFVNHIHLDDYVCRDHLRQAIAFAQQAQAKWRDTGPKSQLVWIVGMNGAEVTVRCHTKRSGERWLADDLDDYEEAVLTWSGAFQSLARARR